MVVTTIGRFDDINEEVVVEGLTQPAKYRFQRPTNEMDDEGLCLRQSFLVLNDLMIAPHKK